LQALFTKLAMLRPFLTALIADPSNWKKGNIEVNSQNQTHMGAVGIQKNWQHFLLTVWPMEAAFLSSTGFEKLCKVYGCNTDNWRWLSNEMQHELPLA
jgi:hypothetical protein